METLAGSYFVKKPFGQLGRTRIDGWSWQYGWHRSDLGLDVYDLRLPPSLSETGREKKSHGRISYVSHTRIAGCKSAFHGPCGRFGTAMLTAPRAWLQL